MGVQRGMTVAEYNAMVAATMREEVLQARVEELLRTYRWEFFHDQDSRRNRAGLPDTIAVRHGRLLFAELKSQTGRLRSAQKVWRHELELVSETTAVAATDTPLARPVEYYLWRPSDLLSGAIEQVLL